MTSLFINLISCHLPTHRVFIHLVFQRVVQQILCRTSSISINLGRYIMYRVFLKKVLHKREEKVQVQVQVQVQEIMKMTQQKDENLVQVQQHYSDFFCVKIVFKSQFFWLIWPFKCLILMILTIAKYHEILLKDSTSSLLFIVKFFSSLKTKMILKTPNETF